MSKNVTYFWRHLAHVLCQSPSRQRSERSGGVRWMPFYELPSYCSSCQRFCLLFSHFSSVNPIHHIIVGIKPCGEARYACRCVPASPRHHKAARTGAVLSEGDVSFAFLSSADTSQAIGFIIVAFWLRHGEVQGDPSLSCRERLHWDL